MIEKLRKIQNNKEDFAAVFTDLSKAFDCISDELLIAKLNECGLDIKSLDFVLSYFINWKQNTKIGFTFSDLLSILLVVLQGLIIESFFFII